MFCPEVSHLSTRWTGTNSSPRFCYTPTHVFKRHARPLDAEQSSRVTSQRACCLAPEALASNTAPAPHAANDISNCASSEDRRRPQKVANGPTAVVQSAAAAKSGPLPDVLAATFPDLYPTLSAARRTIRKGLVQVQGATSDCKTDVQTGDVLQLLELVKKHKGPRPVSLEVAYEDDVMAVVVKPWGVKLYSGDGRRTITGALRAGALIPSSQPDALSEPKPVHRLDAAVGGLLVVAKTASAASHLSTQFEQRTVHKVYQALLSGRLDPGVAAAAVVQQHGTRKQTEQLSSAAGGLSVSEVDSEPDQAEDEGEADNQQQVEQQQELQLTEMLQLQLQGQPPFTITAADLNDSHIEPPSPAAATTRTAAQDDANSSSSSSSNNNNCCTADDSTSTSVADPSSSSGLAPGISADFQIVDCPLEGKACYTLYKVLGYSRCGRFSGWMTTVALSPVTGRKHQLRQHMAALGHPIVGDGKYTSDKDEHISNQGIYLESLEVHFIHPSTQERICVRIPEPKRFRTLREQQHRRWHKLAAVEAEAGGT